MFNQDVSDMVSLGLSDDVVIDKIHGAGATDFDTSIDAMKALKAGKVSDAVIRVMINPHPAPAVSAAPVVAPATSDAGSPQDPALYIMRKQLGKATEPRFAGCQTPAPQPSL